MDDIRIEHYRNEDGEHMRRFFLVAEVRFRSSTPDTTPYYEDSELEGVFADWVHSALEDRDDSPSVTLHRVPMILDTDVSAIARGEYPSDEECRRKGLI